MGLQESLSMDVPLHAPVTSSTTNLVLFRVFVPFPQVLEQVPHSLQMSHTQSIPENYIENQHLKFYWSWLKLMIIYRNLDDDITYTSTLWTYSSIFSVYCVIFKFLIQIPIFSVVSIYGTVILISIGLAVVSIFINKIRVATTFD